MASVSWPRLTLYFFFPPRTLCFCERALPAADFVVLLVRPSLKAFDAAVAAFLEVTLVVRLCASALPAALFEFFPVDGLRRVFDAALAAFGPVFLP